MYTLFISRTAEKELMHISLKDKKRIDLVFERIKREPFKGKKLIGDFKNIYSVKVWPFRILYEIRKSKLVILVLKIAHRKDVYKLADITKAVSQRETAFVMN